MMRFFYILILSGVILPVYSQKPLLDQDAFRSWKTVEGGRVSDDGSLVVYSVSNKSLNTTQLIFWKKNEIETIINNGRNPVFLDYSHKVIFALPRDSIGIYDDGNAGVRYLVNVSQFKTAPNTDASFIAYKSKSNVSTLVLENVSNGQNFTIEQVKDYFFSGDGKLLAFTSAAESNSSSLFLLDLTTGKKWHVFSGGNVSSIIFDKSSGQLVFLEKKLVNNIEELSLWYYKIGAESIMLAGKDANLNSIQRFSKDGSGLFITTKGIMYPKPSADAIKVKVWSYMDTKLQSLQVNELFAKTYPAYIAIADKKIINLVNENETIRQSLGEGDETGRYGMIRDIPGDLGEKRWNRTGRHTFYLIDTYTGVRKHITALDNKVGPITLSPHENYIVFFDGTAQDYFSYHIPTGRIENISKGIKTDWTIYHNEYIGGNNSYYEPAGWLSNDSAILVYDQFDLWLLDPLGKKNPVNITNGFGKKNGITLRMIEKSKFYLSANDNVIVSAFDQYTKDNAFYEVSLSTSKNPKLLSNSSYLYYVPDNYLGSKPLKAKQAKAYMVNRASAEKSPNYFFTNDFKTFTPISNIYPEKEYNWLTTELINYQLLNGKWNQGILYKPENFDPKKKYPVIFHYYEHMSQALHEYKLPEDSDGEVPVSLFVSNGYLVFEPDLHFGTGWTGRTALDGVLAAAKYISTLPFVNAKKMGIQGFSFGGFETNYIVTHSHLFAAACSASGGTDFISYYGNLLGDGKSQQLQFENGQYRVEYSLWEKPELYFDNSPVLKADKVSTPLLMFHTSVDDAVPFGQSIEFFTALRRLGKKVWLLEYEDGNHGVKGKSAADFSVRIRQFFDHYLKDAPAPIWMTRGIPAKLKGIETGFEYDTEIKTPGESPLIEKSKK